MNNDIFSFERNPVIPLKNTSKVIPAHFSLSSFLPIDFVKSEGAFRLERAPFYSNSEKHFVSEKQKSAFFSKFLTKDVETAERRPRNGHNL